MYYRPLPPLPGWETLPSVANGYCVFFMALGKLRRVLSLHPVSTPVTEFAIGTLRNARKITVCFVSTLRKVGPPSLSPMFPVGAKACAFKRAHMCYGGNEFLVAGTE
jgi:hypothetical protein